MRIKMRIDSSFKLQKQKSEVKKINKKIDAKLFNEHIQIFHPHKLRRFWNF
jgi:hypothetical protein